MPGQHRESGGAREVAKKHAQRNALRPDGYNTRAINAFKRIKRTSPNAAGALDEAHAYLRQAMREAAVDPGIPPEQRREQVIRAAAALTKAAEPLKIIAGKDALIREQADDIAELEARVRNAPEEHPADRAGARATTVQ